MSLTPNQLKQLERHEEKWRLIEQKKKNESERLSDEFMRRAILHDLALEAKEQRRMRPGPEREKLEEEIAGNLRWAMRLTEKIAKTK